MGSWKPGGGIPVFPPPGYLSGREDEDPGFSLREEAPGDCRPSSGFFVPGDPDTPWRPPLPTAFSCANSPGNF